CGTYALMPSLGRQELNRATLARQMLLKREKIKPLAAVERLLGLQAQVARPPFVGLWSRVERFGREDLHRLLHDKEVVRATLMRATLHLMSARDFVALRGSLQPVLTLAMRGALRERAQGLDVGKVVDEARAFLHNKPTNFDKLRRHLLTKFP